MWQDTPSILQIHPGDTSKYLHYFHLQTFLRRKAGLFESLRLRSVKEGLAMWLVLFVLARIDWAKGIGQVLASVVGYVKVGTSGALENTGKGSKGHLWDTCATYYEKISWYIYNACAKMY